MSRRIFTPHVTASRAKNDGLLLAFGGYTSGMERIFSDLPALLTHIREAKGESIDEAATGAGLTYRMVWGYESGDTKPPIEKLSLLLAHFGIATFADLQRAHDAMRGVPARQSEAPPPGVDKDEIINILLGSIRELRRNSASQGNREDA